jgi:DNA-directed RNA polymerase specialized sigma24 family protein
LPRQLKEPLVLTMLEGLSHKEAGALLAINAKAVETRVYRAKRQLAALLDPEDLTDISGKG